MEDWLRKTAQATGTTHECAYRRMHVWILEIQKFSKCTYRTIAYNI